MASSQKKRTATLKPAAARAGLLSAISRYAVAYGEAQWTNGWRAAHVGSVDEATLYAKEVAQWESAGLAELAVKKALARYTRAVEGLTMKQKPFCPCGCGHVVQPGNTYAKKGCGLRVRWAARPFNAKQIQRERQIDQHTIVRGRLLKQKQAAPPESWWVGLSREALQAEAIRRAPGTETA